MTDTNNEQAKIGISSVAVAIAIGSVAALVANTLPVFLSVLARTRGLDEAQVGLVAMADLGGIAVGTIATALLPALVENMGWRRVAMVGLLVVALANVLTMLSSSYGGILVTRCLAGIGSGIAMAITYAVLAQGEGARDLALFNVVQLSVGALGMTVLVQIVDGFGQSALFGLIAGLALAALAVCTMLPRYHGYEAATAPGGSERVSVPGWMAIFSALLYFIGVGSIYAYLAFMGIAWGGDAATIESKLSTVMMAAVMGGVVVALVGSRFGFRIPLYIGYAGLFCAIVLLAFVQPVGRFVLFACLFGFAWNILTPYQFEAITHADQSDSAAMLVNASTLGGIAIGPAIAGYLVTSDYLRVNLFAFAACALSLILLLAALRLHASSNLRPRVDFNAVELGR